MAEVGKDITEYLKEFHTTEGKAIKARELCVLFNVHQKQLRNSKRSEAEWRGYM